MSNLLKPIIDELDLVNETLKASIPTSTALSLNSGSWNFPGLNRHDLMARVSELQTLLSNANDPPSNWESYVTTVVERLAFLRSQTVPHIMSQGAIAVSAFLMTIEGIQKSFEPIFSDAKAQAIKNSQAAKKTATQIRSMETRLKDLTPRTKTLDEMVGRIEKAYDAADQLPTDLETLAEAQAKVSELLRQAEQDKFKIEQRLEDIAAIEDDLRAKSTEAEAVLQQSVTAYSSATSVGLAAAFTERSRGLDLSMWGWVGGLVTALLVGSFFGSSQLRLLTDTLANPDVHSVTVGVNLALAFISVGGPVWFAWLSTKQIGQRFRLSEDYAFKASISRAYEGYRREASRIDPSLERKLLESALSRLDEQPLRLVENDSFGSPWHELLSSDVIKDAVKSVPGFVDRMSAMASSALEKKSVSADTLPRPTVASRDATPEADETKA